METLSTRLIFSKFWIGRYFGVNTYIHWTWFVMMFVIFCSSVEYGVIALAAFLCIFLHEFGHVLSAKSFDVNTRSVDLLPFGGVAQIELPDDPYQELVIAFCGPLVNLCLLPVCYIVYYFFPFVGSLLIWINLVIFAFNLLPMFPSDGGRMLRAFLSLATKNHKLATLLTVRIGQMFTLGLAALGIWFCAWIWVVIAVFLYFAAENELAYHFRGN